MDSLEALRSELDGLDTQLGALFERRLGLAKEIAAVKRAQGLPVYDPAREQAVLQRAVGETKDSALREYRLAFAKQNVALCREYQFSLLQSEKTVLPIRLGERSYDVILRPGCLQRAGEYLDLRRRVLIVTDSGVPAQYAACVAKQCARPVVVTVPQGEKSKSLACFERLQRTLLEHGFTRGDCIVAVGGGVVGDLAGFAAACWLRGIDCYLIPTTTLAMTDASVGGKTALNLDGIKNAVGTIVQPKRVLIDPETLSTLPQRQGAAGLAEAVKMGMTSDAALFSLFEQPDPPFSALLWRALSVKKEIVERDEREQGLRRVLNFGHTLGHAIEAQHPELYHGECVALGMLPMCGEKARARLLPVLRRLGLPTQVDLDEERAYRALLHDKKTVENSVCAVFVEEIGTNCIKTVPPEALRQRLADYRRETG